MIIWINGAFGSGKSTVAAKLNQSFPHSFIFDPENTGYYLQDNIPQELRTADFQDLDMWREINFNVLSFIAKKYKGIIIVPMTLVNPVYFNNIVQNLRQDGFPVMHFTLAASKETILRRLKMRGDGKNSWAANQINRCIDGLSDKMFEQIINTDELDTEEVTRIIVESVENEKVI